VVPPPLPPPIAAPWSYITTWTLYCSSSSYTNPQDCSQDIDLAYFQRSLADFLSIPEARITVSADAATVVMTISSDTIEEAQSVESLLNSLTSDNDPTPASPTLGNVSALANASARSGGISALANVSVRSGGITVQSTQTVQIDEDQGGSIVLIALATGAGLLIFLVLVFICLGINRKGTEARQPMKDADASSIQMTTESSSANASSATAKTDWAKDEARPTTSAAHAAYATANADGTSAPAVNSNTDIRDSIFGKSKPPASASPAHCKNPTASRRAASAGGADLRDRIFAGAFDSKPALPKSSNGGGDGACSLPRADPPMCVSRAGSSPFDELAPPPAVHPAAHSTPGPSPFEEPSSSRGGSNDPFGATGRDRAVSDACLSAAAAIFSQPSDQFGNRQRTDSTNSTPEAAHNPFGPSP